MEGLASSTVKYLSIPEVAVDSSAILASNFPALFSLASDTTDFKMSDYTPDDQSPLVRSMVAWLAELPLSPVSSSCDVHDAAHACTALRLCDLLDCTDDHAAVCLSAFAPIKRSLSQVTSICAKFFICSDSSLAAMCEIFPNIEILTLYAIYTCDPWLPCVRCMPGLRELKAEGHHLLGGGAASMPSLILQLHCLKPATQGNALKSVSSLMKVMTVRVWCI